MAPVRYPMGGFPPDERIDWRALIPLVGTASAAIGRYDAMLAATPNSEALLACLTLREAVLSSRIEGIHATMGEVLGFEAGQEPESPIRREDVREVLNCRAALLRAEGLLEALPLSLRVLRETHSILMEGARGVGKAPGEFRRTPNWIGPPGCSIENATFVPIGADALPDAMSTWERYMNSAAPDRLVQLAILHAEFEALHPFLDGNGRLGRMLVPLFLWRCGLIQSPRFYISAALVARRYDYYERLLAVSRDDDWTGWLRFFLEAVRIQAEDDLARAQGIIQLYETMKVRVADLTRSRHAIQLLDWIFRVPIFRSSQFTQATGIAAKTAQRLLQRLTEAEILRVLRTRRGRRPAIFVYPELLNRAEGQKAS